MCATIVHAGLSRSPNELAVVARVSANPGAMCIAMESFIDYSGTITSLAPGNYRVRVFEAEGDRDAKLIGFATVTVTGV
jgi:hypothetical protein